MSLIDNLVLRLKRHLKRVVFPEGADPCILLTAHKFSSKQIGIPILVGDKNKISIIKNLINKHVDLDSIRNAFDAKNLQK